MAYQKGFSLVEVFISLLLVTTIGLALLAQQIQSRQLLTQLMLRAKASQFLDQVDELLFVGDRVLPGIPPPYVFEVKQSSYNTIFRLSWSENGGTLTRKRSSLGFLNE